MNPIMNKPPKINIVGECPLCFNYVCIMKDKKNGTLHCRCLECLVRLSRIEDALAFVRGEIPGTEIGEETADILASKEEILREGWNRPANKVCFCHECVAKRAEQRKPTKPIGWVTVKKVSQTGALFCRCEQCGSIWFSIENAMNLRPYEPGQSLRERFAGADTVQIPYFEAPSPADIASAGWEKYVD